MDMIKKFWPTPFKVKEKDVTSLIVQLIILVVVCAIASILIGVLAIVPIVNILVGIVGGLIDLYCLIGIVLCILKFLGTVK